MLILSLTVDTFSTFLYVIRHCSCVFPNKLSISPHSVLRPIYLVHNISQQAVNKNCYHIIYLVTKVICAIVRVYTREKREREEEEMNCHPSFISHNLRIMLQTVTDPDESNQK
jgi:hypothetical protein